jgi:hypothetical protein
LNFIGIKIVNVYDGLNVCKNYKQQKTNTLLKNKIKNKGSSNENREEKEQKFNYIRNK